MKIIKIIALSIIATSLAGCDDSSTQRTNYPVETKQINKRAKSGQNRFVLTNLLGKKLDCYHAISKPIAY